ncbi:MAG: BTAD domain-containing putative transcriptional regulator, partial [Anaerolineae bacterium]
MLHISLLGALQITLDGRTVEGFDSNKGRALLAYLAVEAHRPHSREFLAGLLWPEQPQEKAFHSLRQSLSALRKAIGDRKAKPPFLLIRGSTLQFNRDSPHWLDVRAFETSAHQALFFCRRQTGGGRVQIRALKRAAACYTADFLDQFSVPDSAAFDEWATLQRATLQRRALEILTLLAEYHERRGEYALALQAAARLAELAPWDETAHGHVMHLLALQGQWSAAQAHYYHCRRVLRKELGLDPAPETVALARQIREASLQGISLPPRFPVPPSHLPSPSLPFVGRESELDALAERMADADCRLVALLGPGGVGKTRLALKAAWEQAGLFRDGVFFVPLAAAPSAEYAAPAIAAALQHNLVGRDSPEQQLVDLLRDKELLLVVDNLEHLPDTAELWADIFKNAPGVKLMATSRQPLALRACRVIEVRGLDVPAEGETGRPLSDYSALKLFQQTASRLLPGFQLADQADPVVRICRLLAGIPLGIELSAAWIREMPIQEIARQIEADLDFLASPMRDVPARHRSMRAVFGHSWRLLDAEEQQILAALSVFRGGFCPDAARQVAAATPQHLAKLAAKSLLQRQVGERYHLLELLRQFAAEKLAAQGNQASIQARHAGYYADLLQAQERAWQAAQERSILDVVGRDLENARAAWQWAVAGGHLAEIAKCAAILARYHRIRGPFRLGERLLAEATERLAGHDEAAALLAGLYGEQAKLHLELGDYEQAAALAQQAIDLARQVGDDGLWAAGHVRLGEAHYRQGQHEAAQEHLEQALVLSRRAGSLAWEAASLRPETLYGWNKSNINILTGHEEPG